MTKNTNSVESGKAHNEEAADFDKAINASGFGLFNLILVIVAIPATCGSMFESTTMSYILPIAECDLKLTLFDKGILNASAYAGMIVSAMGWGYLADIKGRKKILVYGYIVDALCVLGSSLSQNFQMLVLFKFLGGLVVNGPAAVLFTYLVEFHGPKHRPRISMVVGMITSVTTTFLPLLAWGIFPRPWYFEIFNVIEVHTWQIFLFVCCLPSLLCGFLLAFMPESPKFLMSQGRNEEALEVFRKVYAINTRKPRDTYPIKMLIMETESEDTTQRQDKQTSDGGSIMHSLRAGMQQMKPLLHKPLLARSLQCYIMQFCILQGLNTIRLWLPQLFASIAEYELAYADTPDSSTNMCTILEYSVNRTAYTVQNHEEACSEPIDISIDMYRNNIVVSFSGLLGYFFAGSIVRAIGSKLLLTLSLFISGCLGMGLFFSSSGLSTLIISSLFVTIGSVSTSCLLNVVTGHFPTHVRTLVVSTVMMCGRLGALTGNVLFPVFIEIGCMPPFLLVCIVMLVASALSMVLPNPDKKPFT